jgi:hypothetical protein
MILKNFDDDLIAGLAAVAFGLTVAIALLLAQGCKAPEGPPAAAPVVADFATAPDDATPTDVPAAVSPVDAPSPTTGG